MIEQMTLDSTLENEILMNQNERLENTFTPMSDTNNSLTQFNQELEKFPLAEEKIQFSLTTMENAIALGKTPDFKLFWEVRKKCLDLFKENVPPSLRSQFWNKFSELSKEARRLKDQLDEQSSFAAEQIDIAIQAIENEITQYQEGLLNIAQLDYVAESQTLSSKSDFYSKIQQELNFLNLFASRITSLRKELIHTEMRIRTKNKFFERLSKAGDFIFPKRKSLIQEISQQFSTDVEDFVKKYFNNSDSKDPIYVLREEIKNLQSIAKNLTLNTQAFSSTRLKLSHCWDQLKEKDQQRKVELEKKKEIFTKNFEELNTSLGELKEKLEKNEISNNEVLNNIDEIVKKMRAIELGRDEVKELRNRINELRDQVYQKQRVEENERLQAEQERSRVKRELYEQVKNKFLAFVEHASTLTVDEIYEKKVQLINEIQAQNFNKAEKADLEKLFKPLKEIIKEKKEAALLLLPENELQALEQLKELLNQKEEDRNDIEEQLKHYKKLAASSGLDFQKAIEYQDKLAEIRLKLEAANQAVQDVEAKIEELESRLG